MLCKWALSTLSANGAFGGGGRRVRALYRCVLWLCWGFSLFVASSSHPIQNKELCICVCASNAFDMLISNSESRNRLSNLLSSLGTTTTTCSVRKSEYAIQLGGPRQITHTRGVIFNNHVKRATNRDKQSSLKLSPSSLLSCQASVGFLSSVSSNIW